MRQKYRITVTDSAVFGFPSAVRKERNPSCAMIKGEPLYSRRELNPHDRNGHRILSPACLPIPPLEHPVPLLLMFRKLAHTRANIGGFLV